MRKKSHFTALMVAGVLAGGLATAGLAQQGQTQTDRPGQTQTDRPGQTQTDRPGQSQTGRDGAWQSDNQSRQGDNMQRRQDGSNQQKAWQEDDLMGWADSDDFASSLGMSQMERKALFPFWEEEQLARRVNLTPDQTKTLTESYIDTCKDVEKAKSEARIAAIDLHAEMGKTQPNVSDAKKYADRMSKALQDKRAAIVSHAALAKRTLNEQQQEALKRAGQEYAQTLRTELSDLREQIGESMSNGDGNLDEVQAILEGSNVPVQIRDRMYDDASRRMERGDTWDSDNDRSGRMGTDMQNRMQDHMRNRTDDAPRTGIQMDDAGRDTRTGTQRDDATGRDGRTGTQRDDAGRSPSTTPTPQPTTTPRETPERTTTPR